MHNNENTRKFLVFLAAVGGFLPILFWLTLIFSFDTPKIAYATILAVVIHEFGHFLVLVFLGKEILGFRGALSGLRIKSALGSYNADFLIYLGGPLANFATALIYAVFFSGEHAVIFVTINLATGLSNLLPAEGYDGYGMIKCLIMKHGFTRFGFRFLDCISLFTVSLLCILSLYLIDRLAEGYWVFFVFFFSTLKKLATLLKQ